MNEFADINNSGLLKINYEAMEDQGMSPLQQALKKRRESLAQTKLGSQDNPLGE